MKSRIASYTRAAGMEGSTESSPEFMPPEKTDVTPHTDKVQSEAEHDGATPSTHLVSESQSQFRRRADELWRSGNNLLSPRDLDALCLREQSSSSTGVVEGLIPRGNVTFLIGDSGLGKSPLAYQLGLCVAAGVPFLGRKTLQGTVVYADYENDLDASQNMRRQLVKFLGLKESPENFLLWTPHHQSEDSIDLEGACAGRPSLLIIDAIRSHSPHFEKTEYAGDQMKQLNSLARRYGVAILPVHHVRKPGENGAPSLDSEDMGLMLRLKQAAGHSSIINQSHTRIAVDLPDGRKNLDAALIVRWHRRVKGECGPLYLERVCDDDSEPLGYRPLADVKLLGNPDQEDSLRKLPQEFSFSDAKKAYGRSDDPTRKWLQKCTSIGLVRQTGRGRYERADDSSTGPLIVSPKPAGR